METFSALLAICAGNSPVSGDFPAQRPVTRVLMFSLICAWINCWVNNGEAGDYRCYRTHYDVIVMIWIVLPGPINAKAWLHWTRNHLGQPDFQSGNLKFTIAFMSIWLDMRPLKLQRVIRIWWQGCPLGRNILHYVVGIDHVFVSGAVGLPVTLRAARRWATPRVRGGASNQGSWCKNVVNFNSTMII